MGYLLILIGMHKCREESKYFANARSFSWVGLILSGLWFGIKLTGLKNMPFSVPVIMELAELAVSIIVVYLMVAAIREQEELMQLRPLDLCRILTNPEGHENPKTANTSLAIWGSFLF